MIIVKLFLWFVVYLGMMPLGMGLVPVSIFIVVFFKYICRYLYLLYILRSIDFAYLRSYLLTFVIRLYCIVTAL